VTTGPQEPVARRDRLRAGHGDREQVIEALKTAFVDGRLTKSELAARTGQALVARTYADLAALTADIPAEPVTAVPAPARPPAPAIRRPLAKAAAASGLCLVVATAAMGVSHHFDPGGPGPNPYHAWSASFYLLSVIAVITALSVLVHGVATSIEQRRSRGQLPPGAGPGGHVLDGERHDGSSHGPVPPGPRTDETRTDLRARKSRHRGPRIPARTGRAPGGASPAPGAA
jgi:DUF1707 SHOCT-like domain